MISASKKPTPDLQSRDNQKSQKSSSARSGPQFFDFPSALKDPEWLQRAHICSTGDGSRRISAPKKSRQKTAEKKKEELTVTEEAEETETLTADDDDAAWERLRQSGYMDHIDENDPDLIAKNMKIAAMNKFKLHPIKRQHWDIRKALDGSRPITRQEVAFHCDNGDILLIRNRRVINAMNIVLNTAHQDKILPLMQMKGQDISHWFNPITGEPRIKIDLKTGKKVLYTPNGFYYGLGPIRRQLELEQETVMITPSTKSSVAADLNEGAPSQLDDYETYITDDYSEKNVSGFAAPKRKSVLVDQGIKEETEGEDTETAGEQSGEDKEGEGEDVEFEGEGDELEENSEEMNDNLDTGKSKKSIKSGESDLSNVSPGDKSGSSAKVLSSSPKEVKSNESSQGNASPDPSMMTTNGGKSDPKIRSNPELSPHRSLHNVGSSKSITNARSKSGKSITKSDSNEEDNPRRKSNTKSDPAAKSDEDKSGEDRSGQSGSTSPPSVSPKYSETTKRKRTDGEGEDDDEYHSSDETVKEEDGEDVISNMSSSHSLRSAFTNAEGSRFEGAFSTVPQLGSEHSLLSEVASVYSKTTVDTTAVASTVYGVQTDVFPGVSWVVHDPNYEEKWWVDPKYVCGYVPRTTLSIRIINSLSYDERTLVVSKEYTINDIMRYYLPYNHNAMGYRWEDMFGNVLHPERTVVENGLVDMALAEDNGFNCYPVIILVFVDGFEDEPIISLNPKELAKQMTVSPICRNY